MGSLIQNLTAKFFGCGVPKEDQLNDVLTDYVSSDVNFNQELMARHKSLIDRVIKILEDAFKSPSAKKQLQAFRFHHVIKSGSSFENLKVRHPDEFDIMFVFDVNELRSWTTVIMDQESDNSGYVKFDVVRAMLDSLTTSQFTKDFCNNKLYEDKIFEVLSPTKFYQRVGGFMAKVLRETPMHYSSLPLEVDLHDCFGNGAAVTVTVKDEVTGEEMSLDLVLTLQIQSSHGNKLLVPRKDHWRQSSSLDEKHLIEHIECRNEIYPLVLRIMKTISCKEKATSPLCKIDSYTYKNAIFWLWQEESSNATLSGVFRRYLVFLRDRFESGQLPRYFENSRNLLDVFDKNLLKFLAGYINNIITNDHYVEFVLMNSVKYESRPAFLDMVVKSSLSKAESNFDDPNVIVNLRQHFENHYVQERLKLSFKNALALGVNKVALIFCLEDAAFLRDGPIMDHYGYTAYRVIQGIDSLQPEVHQTYVKKGTKSLDAMKLYSAIMEEVKLVLSYADCRPLQVVPAVSFEKDPNFILTPAKNSDSTLFRKIVEQDLQYKVNRMDIYDNGCRQQVLDLLKIALVENPRISLSEEICEAAVLNNADNFRFSHDNQVEFMVTFILDYINGCLAGGNMSDPADSEVNILSNYQKKSLDLVSFYLMSLKEKGRYDMLFYQCF